MFSLCPGSHTSMRGTGYFVCGIELVIIGRKNELYVEIDFGLNWTIHQARICENNASEIR